MKVFSISKLGSFDNRDGIPNVDDFSYPWRDEEAPKTIFQAYYDDEFIHFQFLAYGPTPFVYVKDNNKLEVIHSERVEIFFRTNEKMRPYYVLEMDPHGRVLDYKANHYREFDRSWEWPDSLDVQTSIHEDHYTLQGKFNIETLQRMNLIQENEIQIGLYRGHCTEMVNGKANVKWMSWVGSGTEEPDFHVPSSFGILRLQ